MRTTAPTGRLRQDPNKSTPPRTANFQVATQFRHAQQLKVPRGYEPFNPNAQLQEDLRLCRPTIYEETDVRKLLQGRIAINQRFEFRQGDATTKSKRLMLSRQDENLISMSPHMHLRGKSFRYEIRFLIAQRRPC